MFKFKLNRTHVPSGGLRVRKFRTLDSAQVGSLQSFSKTYVFDKVCGDWAHVAPEEYETIKKSYNFSKYDRTEEGWCAIRLRGNTLLEPVADSQEAASQVQAKATFASFELAAGPAENLEVTPLDDVLGPNVEPAPEQKNTSEDEFPARYLSGGTVYAPVKTDLRYLSGRVVRRSPATNTAELARFRPCGSGCEITHEGECLKCGRPRGSHNGRTKHTCEDGERAQWSTDYGCPLGQWKPGDLIARLPRDCRPSTTLVFGALACAAPKWPYEDSAAEDGGREPRFFRASSDDDSDSDDSDLNSILDGSDISDGSDGSDISDGSDNSEDSDGSDDGDY